MCFLQKTEIYRGQWKNDKREGPGIERDAKGKLPESENFVRIFRNQPLINQSGNTFQYTLDNDLVSDHLLSYFLYTDGMITRLIQHEKSTEQYFLYVYTKYSMSECLIC